MTIPADIAVHCGSRLHEFGPFAPAPEATFWFGWHDCIEGLACTDCFDHIIDRILGKLNRNDSITCPQCRRRFTTMTDYVRWVQL